jgi:hypothetical protein
MTRRHGLDPEQRIVTPLHRAPHVAWSPAVVRDLHAPSVVGEAPDYGVFSLAGRLAREGWTRGGSPGIFG